MALDTQGKMMNALSMASPLAWQFHFEIDGSIDQIDMAHLLHLYGGNDIDGAVVATDKLAGSLMLMGVGN